MQQHDSNDFAHRPPPPTLKGGVIFFQNMVKLKGIANEATYKHIFCPYTHLDPWGGVKGQN